MFRQNDQISSLLLEAISEAVVVIDNHQKVVEINNTAEDIFGYSKEELIGKRGMDINPSFSQEKSRALWLETKEKGDLPSVS